MQPQYTDMNDKMNPDGGADKRAEELTPGCPLSDEELEERLNAFISCDPVPRHMTDSQLEILLRRTR